MIFLPAKESVPYLVKEVEWYGRWDQREYKQVCKEFTFCIWLMILRSWTALD